MTCHPESACTNADEQRALLLKPHEPANVEIAVLTVFAMALLVTGCSDRRVADREQQLGKARELFNRRCALAGETIKRTVTDVEGVFVLKVRPKDSRFGDQFRLNDPYGSDFGGEAYIQSFLSAKYENSRRFAESLRDRKPAASDAPVGYSFVELIDPQDQQRYRYTAYLDQPGKTDPAYARDYWRVILEKSPALEAQARYGVTFDDISTTEERSLWIAGSSLKVIDLKTKEVIAERIGYMLDPGQGSAGAGGGRSTWLVAASTACPAFPGRHGSEGQLGQTDRFVEKVLIPVPVAARESIDAKHVMPYRNTSV